MLSGPRSDEPLAWSASIRLSSSASIADRACSLGGSRPRERSASARRSLEAISFGRAIDTACARLLCNFTCSLSRVCLVAEARTRSLLVSDPKKVLARFGWRVRVKFCPIETFSGDLARGACSPLRALSEDTDLDVDLLARDRADLTLSLAATELTGLPFTHRLLERDGVLP